MAGALRKLLIILCVILIGLLLIKRKDMNWRQSFLKTVYPLLMLKSKWFPSSSDVALNKSNSIPLSSFYDLTATANDGTVIDLNSCKGKKVLIVNTASDCGFTAQYDELEQLHQRYPDLIVLGFPANDFKQQEKGSDASIAEFCRINYGVTFQLMQKTQVIKGDAQSAVFYWLSHAAQNGWCEQAPTWNFSKYVIDEKGVLQAFFKQNVSPLDKRVIKFLE